jgi:hypothetical protein
MPADCYLDVVTVVFPGNVGRYKSWVSGGSGGASDQGILAWRSSPGVFVPLGAPVLVTGGENDIQCGMVNLRLMYGLSAGSSTRYLQVALGVSYENIGARRRVGGESARFVVGSCAWTRLWGEAWMLPTRTGGGS